MDLRTARIAVVLVALVLGPVVVLRYVETQRQLHSIEEGWQSADVIGRHPKAYSVAVRLSDLQRSRLSLARVLLVDSLAVERLGELSLEEGLEESANIKRRLRQAEKLATQVLEEQPSSWEAETILGGVLWLDQLSESSASALSPEDWETHLARALQLGPTQIEPLRLLTASYLTRWHTLSDREREQAGKALGKTLTDSASLDLLLPGWMAIASKEQLFESLPDSSLAWRRVITELARQHRWNDYCEAREEWHQTLWRETEDLLREAEARRAGGDIATARKLYLQVIGRAAPELQNLDHFTRALLHLPPGPLSESSGPAIRSWTQWGVALWMLDQPSLPASVFQRLSGFDSLLSPRSLAVAALAAGDLSRAETLERRSDETWSEDWAPYLLGKTKFLLESNRLTDAIEALGQVHRSYRTSPLYLALQRNLRSKGGAESATETRQPSMWLPSDWTWRGQEVSLVVNLSESHQPLPTPTLIEMTFDDVRPLGNPVEIQWNGHRLGCWSVGEESVEAQGVELSPGLHRITVHKPAYGTAKPGSLRLPGLEDQLPATMDPAIPVGFSQ